MNNRINPKLYISKAFSNKLKDELENINMRYETVEYNFENDKIIVYDGYEVLFEDIKSEINENTNLNDKILFKKGDKNAPGLFKCGSLKEKEYTNILISI